MITNYTREAGVRQLERKIGDICRKSAKEILEDHKKSVGVTEKNLSKYLGQEIYTCQMANKEDEVGIVRGLAWTSVGGDTLQIEVNVMPGSGAILLSAQIILFFHVRKRRNHIIIHGKVMNNSEKKKSIVICQLE